MLSKWVTLKSRATLEDKNISVGRDYLFVLCLTTLLLLPSNNAKTIGRTFFNS